LKARAESRLAFEATHLVLSNFFETTRKSLLMHQPDVMRFEDIKAA
jgi:hypothetical protein